MEFSLAGIMKKVNLKDQVYDYLLNAILNQDFKRGENINLDELCRTLGVSNTPIRESINALVTEGLIEYKPNMGFYVINPDRKTINEMLQVVFFLVIAAYRFCYRNGMMDEILPKMKIELEKQRKYLEAGDSLGYIEITHNFEGCIIEGVGNSMLLKEYESKKTLLAFISTYYSDNNLDSLKKVFAQHEEIFKKMNEGKLEDVVFLMRDHFYKKEEQ